MTDPDAHRWHVRLAEATLFAEARPLTPADLRARLPAEADLGAVLEDLAAAYDGRGVELARVGEGYAFRTAPDLTGQLRLEVEVPKKLTRAAVETLAIIAYHQPVTRAEIESIRGVATSRGTLDTLMDAGWIRPGRRRQTPGRPVTWITTPVFLEQFGLISLDDLPGVADLRAAGLLDARPAITALPGGRVEEGGDRSLDDAAAEEEQESLQPSLLTPLRGEPSRDRGDA